MATLESMVSKTEYLKTLTTQWIIPSSKIRKSLRHYFLRHWTAAEISDKLDSEILSYYDIPFQVLIDKRTQNSLVKEHFNFTSERLKYWLSFRAGYYDGEYFAFVIIQSGKKDKEESNHDA